MTAPRPARPENHGRSDPAHLDADTLRPRPEPQDDADRKNFGLIDAVGPVTGRKVGHSLRE